MKFRGAVVLFAFLLIRQFSLAQGNNPFTAMTTEQEFSKKYLMYFDQYASIINNQKVMGSPFFYPEWSTGTVTTADGRFFDGYKLRYDLYSQSIFFLSGTDSLQVNEDIKEFVLKIPEDDKLTSYRFVNASNYKKEKTPFYYQVLIDESKGQLLKTNKKTVAEMSSGLPAYEGKKYFRQESAYYFYDKASQKITRVKADGSNLPALLQLSPDKTTELENLLNSVNPGDDLVSALRPYFKS